MLSHVVINCIVLCSLVVNDGVLNNEILYYILLYDLLLHIEEAFIVVQYIIRGGVVFTKFQHI